jgi:hypothetical protein
MNDKIADDMYNGQRVVPVRAISGNVATLNEKLAEVVVDTGSGKQRCVAVKQFGGGSGGGSVDDVQVNGTSVVSDGVANLTATTLASPVRGVRPEYTQIPASSATYTLSSNATFGQTPSQAVTYTLPTVISGVDNWCKLFVDCTTTASIAFTTTDSTTITPVGSPTITQGNSYIFVCQYDNLAETWKVFLVDATV